MNQMIHFAAKHSEMIMMIMKGNRKSLNNMFNNSKNIMNDNEKMFKFDLLDSN